MKLWAVLRRCSEGGAPALSCSFCARSQRDVRRLIAGPGVRICDECIALCNEIIAYDIESEDREKPPEPSPDR